MDAAAILHPQHVMICTACPKQPPLLQYCTAWELSCLQHCSLNSCSTQLLHRGSCSYQEALLGIAKGKTCNLCHRPELSVASSCQQAAAFHQQGKSTSWRMHKEDAWAHAPGDAQGGAQEDPQPWNHCSKRLDVRHSLLQGHSACCRDQEESQDASTAGLGTELPCIVSSTRPVKEAHSSSPWQLSAESFN